MKYSDIPLPKAWPKRVKSALINAVSLAHTSITFSRAWCADSSIRRVQLTGDLDQAKQEIALLREEVRIKDARMVLIPPHQRPFYPPTERLSILTYRAARGWNLEQTARAFLVEPATISSWMKRLDENGEQALVKLPTPVNKYPDFITLVVKQLKVLCPVMGKKRIAQIICRAGLAVSATSVSRFLKKPAKPSHPTIGKISIEKPEQIVTAKYPDHLWHVDLTIIPAKSGFWVPWFPFALLQRWPFCWFLAVVIDHFSRRIVGFDLFKQPPTSKQITTFLTGLTGPLGHVPKHIVSDKGTQFWCQTFKSWCRKNNIKPRFGAIGHYGSIAVIERFIRSLKTDCTRRIIVPLGKAAMQREMTCYAEWFNAYRPHQGLGAGRRIGRDDKTAGVIGCGDLRKGDNNGCAQVGDDAQERRGQQRLGDGDGKSDGSLGVPVFRGD